MDPDDLVRFEAYVRASSARLLFTARLLTGDAGHAEDLVQLTLERLARNWGRVEFTPDRYAHRTLVNLANDRWRRLRRRVGEAHNDAGLTRSVPDDTATVAQRHDLVTALRQLPLRQRTVLVLRYFEDLSEQDTAAAMDCSVGTVKSTTSRALANLRRLAATTDDLVRSTR